MREIGRLGSEGRWYMLGMNYMDGGVRQEDWVMRVDGIL